MRNINIIINQDHTVDFQNDYAGLNLENLQGNITFSFEDFVEGQARAEIVINNQDGYIPLEQVGNTYVLPIKSSLLTGDSILMQLVIDQTNEITYNLTTDTSVNPNKTYYEKVGDNYLVVSNPNQHDLPTYYEASIPVWKSETFFLQVGYSINATTTIPEDYPSWTSILNGLITQTQTAITQAENVNITSEQLTDGVKVITTDKTGQQTITIVPQGPQGEPGVPGAVKALKVNKLPTEDIKDDTIYLVPMPVIEVETLPATGQMYTIYVVTSTQKRYRYVSGQWVETLSNDNNLEYMYIDNAWELVGQADIEIDLTDYVKNTDYASNNTAGVIKTQSNQGTAIYSSGVLYAITRDYAGYQSLSSQAFISKGTLENVITGKGLVSNTIIKNANSTTAGDVYDVRYINSLIGDIGTILDSINNEVL